LAGLHTVLRWQTFSLVSFPLVLSIIIVFTVPRPWVIFLGLVTVAEFGSGLPGGTLAVAMLIPLVVGQLPKRPASGLSWTFFAYLVCITTLQTAWLTAWPLVLARHGLAFTDIPAQLPAVIIASAGAAFIAIMVWREWVEPLPHHKTIPRYNRMAS